MKKIFWNEYVSIGAMTISIGALILSMVVPGPAGIPGSNGDNGSNGSNGTNGVDGTNGSDGINGSNGIDGLDGEPGDGVEFSIIDGVMMYRVGNGAWQRYLFENPYQDEIDRLDLPYITTEEFSVLDTFNTMDPRSFNVGFQPVVNQSEYVQNRLNQGYIPIATPQAFLSIDDFEAEYVLTANLDFDGILMTSSALGQSHETLDALVESEDIFFGRLDGAGFTIENVNFTGTSHLQGLFSGFAGSVGNLTLKNFAFDYVTPTSGVPLGYGFLAGVGFQSALVENITILGGQIAQTSNAGSLFGLVTDPGFLTQNTIPLLINQVDVELFTLSGANNSFYLGGLIGSVDNAAVYIADSSLSDAFFGNIKRSSGGFIGHANNATIAMFNNSLEDISIESQTDAEFLGGFVGSLEYTYTTFINNHLDSVSFDSFIQSYVGGLVGGIINASFLEIYFSMITNLNILGRDYVGGLVGGLYIGDPQFIESSNIAFGANSVDVYINAREFIGGLIGHFISGNLFVFDNLVQAEVVLSRSTIGGLVGLIEPNTTFYLVNNVVNFLYTLPLAYQDSQTNNYGYVGGLVGVIDANVFGQIENNQVISTMTILFQFIPSSSGIEVVLGIRALGGLIGLMNADTQLIVVNVQSHFTLNITLHYTGMHPDSEQNSGMMDIGGIIGVASRSDMYVMHSHFTIDVSLTYRLTGGFANDLSQTLSQVGGAIGHLELSTLMLNHVALMTTITVTFERTNPLTQFGSFAHYATRLGGIIGYLQESVIDGTLIQIQFDFVIEDATNNLAYDNGFFLLVLSDIGSLIGYVRNSLNASFSNVFMTMSLTIQPSILTMIETNPASANLSIQNTAGFVGSFSDLEPDFNQMTLDNVLLNFRIDEALQLSPLFELTEIFTAFGNNPTPFYKIIARDVYAYSNVTTIYGQGVYPFQLVQMLTSQAYAQQMEYFTRSPMWTRDNLQLHLQFFSPLNSL